MKLKVFTMIYEPGDGFDDGAMHAFLQDKLVLSVQEHFFIHEQVPAWALLVSYRDNARPGERERTAGVDAQLDSRAEVAKEDQPLFDALRKWRNERSKREGRPAYILLTNRQLADVARLRPSTLEMLQHVQGIGEAKVQAFGEELLAVIARVVPSIPVVAPAAAEPSRDE